jgi:hypothetical protein
MAVSATPPLEYSNADLRRVRVADGGEQEWEFSCECGKDGCRARVFLTLDAYIELHEGSGVVLADGHSESQIGRARRLRDEAEALKRQAEHQTSRARRHLTIARISRRDA